MDMKWLKAFLWFIAKISTAIVKMALYIVRELVEQFKPHKDWSVKHYYYARAAPGPFLVINVLCCFRGKSMTCAKWLHIYIDPFTEVIYALWTNILTGVIISSFITLVLCTIALKIWLFKIAKHILVFLCGPTTETTQ